MPLSKFMPSYASQTPDDQEPTLIEFCEPFFLEVGNVLRRQVDSVGDAWKVRNQLKLYLDDLYESAKKRNSASLLTDYQRIEPVLAFFADDVINASTLPFADKWKETMLLASDVRIGIKDGRIRFFQELDATLNGGAMAAQRLAVFQSCLGLGFGGVHRGNTDKLRDYADRILQQLEFRLTSAQDRVCAEAYEYTQAERLCNPITQRFWAIGIVCGGLILATLITYCWICHDASGQIARVLGEINTASASDKFQQ